MRIKQERKPQEQKFLSIREVAEVLGVNPKTIYADISRGKIPYIRVGNLYKIPKAFVMNCDGAPCSENTTSETPQI